jgi:hypothetical protein
MVELHAAKKPYDKANNQYEADNPSNTSSAIAIVAVVAAATAEQQDYQNYDNNCAHHPPSRWISIAAQTKSTLSLRRVLDISCKLIDFRIVAVTWPQGVLGTRIGIYQ